MKTFHQWQKICSNIEFNILCIRKTGFCLTKKYVLNCNASYVLDNNKKRWRDKVTLVLCVGTTCCPPGSIRILHLLYSSGRNRHACCTNLNTRWGKQCRDFLLFLIETHRKAATTSHCVYAHNTFSFSPSEHWHPPIFSKLQCHYFVGSKSCLTFS